MFRKLLLALALLILVALTIPVVRYQLCVRSAYCCFAFALQSLFILGLIVGSFTVGMPWFAMFGREVLLLSSFCGTLGEHFYVQAIKAPSSSAYDSWHRNSVHLSQIPAVSDEASVLLQFLERRWLSKANGFVAPMIDWVYPCFGMHPQIHPDTTCCYARNPSTMLSKTYIKLIDAWKASTSEKERFPFVLTRRFNLSNYLPNYNYLQSIPDLKGMMKSKERLIVDCTNLLQNKPLSLWDSYQVEISKICKECNFPLNQLFCIQRVEQKEVGGIRLLPLKGCSKKEVRRQEHFLLERLGRFGFSANPIEMDRAISSLKPVKGGIAKDCGIFPNIETFVFDLGTLVESVEPHKRLMIEATVQLLKGLATSLPDDCFRKALECPTKRAVINFALSSIQEKLLSLSPTLSFFEVMNRIEEVHYHLSALLEVFRPFQSEDFKTIYHGLLSMPERLKPLTSCTLHVSGMTAFGGIVKAVEKTVGHFPRILCGENSYFECLAAARTLGQAKLLEEASPHEIQDADLILAQFNPVLRRGEFAVDEYRVEKVSENLRRALRLRKGKPLTLALDATFDFVRSSRANELLHTFADEIEKGALNIISYRSGSKFDLFGMDNYCGAPLYMVHNKDVYWDAFDALLTDPLLQTDLLSLNWFCLAYQHTASHLDQYRKQVFNNTRALLNQLPLPRLHHPYRIIPFATDADPTFVEIQVKGPFHQVRAGALVGGSLLVNCLTNQQPIFTRPSLGFYHPNFTIIFGKDYSSVRITLGLDPRQIELLTNTLTPLINNHKNISNLYH